MHKKTCIHSSTEMSMQYSVSTILSRWAPNTICINHSVTKHIHPVLLTNTAATLQKDRVVPLHSLPKLLDNTHSIHDIICWRKAATFWGTQAIIKQGLCLQCTSASRWGWEAGGREKCENLCSCLYVWGKGWQEKKEKHTNISARSSGWVEDRSNLYLQNCTRVSPFMSYRIWYSRKLDVGKNERKSCNSKTRKVKSSSRVRKKKTDWGKTKQQNWQQISLHLRRASSVCLCWLLYLLRSCNTPPSITRVRGIEPFPAEIQDKWGSCTNGTLGEKTLQLDVLPQITVSNRTKFWSTSKSLFYFTLLFLFLSCKCNKQNWVQNPWHFS